MKVIKFFIYLIFIFAILTFCYGYLSENDVVDKLVDYYKKTPSSLENNGYIKDINIDFVQKTNDFEADNKQEIMNIYYTIISSGMNEFTFYCGDNYEDCMDDVLDVNDDPALLSQMNNFVNIYNTFRSIKTTYTTNGKITVNVEKVYSNSDIEEINTKVNEIYDEVVNTDKDSAYNIKMIHDYIINNTKYDLNEENSKIFSESSTAIGTLFNGLATCNGYTDAMSIFLDKLEVTNVRISNDEHIWNLVYLGNNWLHLDLTWDDPVNNLNKDMLVYDYYLKTTDEVKTTDTAKNKTDHEFDENIYNFIY
ncbi:MAG TPA: transglutaminase domain-containing protein [Bacilli bacterium]|nr:transglutaminase domain-containing protein [Bacilli bacterium]